MRLGKLPKNCQNNIKYQKSFKALMTMKKIYIILTFLSIMFCPFIAKAQATYEDVVYLKNGSIIHGIIIEQIPNESLKIQTKDGNVFVYKMAEIEKITKEVVKGSENSSTNNSEFEIKHSGFTNITEFYAGGGIKETVSKFMFGVHTINGYLINPHFSVGVGVGLELSNSLMIPIFADFRYNFTSKSVSPFFSVDAGYIKPINDSYYLKRIFVDPALGLKFFVLPKTALNFSLGCRLEKYTTTYLIYPTNTLRSYKGGYLNFKMGFTF